MAGNSKSRSQGLQGLMFAVATQEHNVYQQKLKYLLK